MRNKLFCLMIGILLGAALMVPWILLSSSTEETQTPPQIMGDLAENITLKPWPDWTEKTKVTCKGVSYKVIPLNEVLKKVDLLGTLEKVYFMGHDGFTSVIDSQDLKECYLSYDKKSKWSVIAPKHPISTNAKNLEKIVLLSGGKKAIALTVQKSDESIETFSLGQLLSGPVTMFPHFEGKSVAESAGRKYSSMVYTRDYGFSLRDFVEMNATDYLLLRDGKGIESFLKDSGYFTIKGLRINYVDGKGGIYKNIKEIKICPYITLNQQ